MVPEDWRNEVKVRTMVEQKGMRAQVQPNAGSPWWSRGKTDHGGDSGTKEPGEARGKTDNSGAEGSTSS